MKRLLLLSCSATKRPDPDLMPAIERYDGPVYRVVRAFRAEGRRLPKIRILSAHYGLIEPGHPIRDYDARMTPEAAAMFMADYRGRHAFQRLVMAADDVLVVAGSDYAEVFRSWWPRDADGPLPMALAEGGIGMKLKRTREWLRAG